MPINRCLVASTLAIASLAISTVSASPAQSARAEVAEKRGVGPVDRLILDSRETGRGKAWLKNQLLPRGRSIGGDLFDVLSAGSLQLRVGERGRAMEPLLLAERDAILGAFGQWPKKAVDELLKDELSADPSVADRCSALEIFATLDMWRGDEALGSMLEWSQIEGDKVRVPRRVRSALEVQIEAFLLRCPDAARLVPNIYSRANASLLPAILSGTGKKATPERLDALATFLGVVPRFDAHVLAEIKVMLGHARFVPSESSRAIVRQYISSTDRALAVEAISIEELTADPAAIPPLLDYLNGTDRDLRRRALSALTAISGEQLEPTLETWSEWHARTLRWWQRDLSRHADLARRGAPGAAARAIQELSLLRAYRHKLVPVLAAVLERDEVNLVVLATASLGHLNSMDAIPHLVSQLEKENVDVRRAAYQSLRRMTGENYSDDPDAWRAAGWGVIKP